MHAPTHNGYDTIIKMNHYKGAGGTMSVFMNSE